MQKHWDVMRSDDAGDSWKEVSGNLPTDFGFAIDVHAHEPEDALCGAHQERLGAFSPEGKLRVYRSRSGGHEWEGLTKGLPQKDCYVNVLRMRWPWTRWMSAAFISARQVGRCTPRPTQARTGRRLCAICLRC